MVNLIPGEINYNLEAQKVYFESLRKEGETLEGAKHRFFSEMKTEKPWQLIIHHDMLYKLYKWIDDFCEKNNIHYWLTGGALIGAIRHQGLIPWDTDGDIGMHRSDFADLCELLDGNKEVELAYSITERGIYPKIKWKHLPYLTIDIFIHDLVCLNSDQEAKDFWHNEFLPARKEYKERLKTTKDNMERLRIMNETVTKMNYPLEGNYITWDVAGYETESYVRERICRVSRIFPLKKAKYGDIELYIPNEAEKYIYEEHGDIWSLPPTTNISAVQREKLASCYAPYLELPEYKWLKERGY